MPEVSPETKPSNSCTVLRTCILLLASSSKIKSSVAAFAETRAARS